MSVPNATAVSKTPCNEPFICSALKPNFANSSPAFVTSVAENTVVLPSSLNNSVKSVISEAVVPNIDAKSDLAF